MSFSIRGMFSNLFLSVLIEDSECIFYGRVVKNKEVINTINAKFTDINPEDIDQKVLDFIQRQEKNYSNIYISLFFNSPYQGALPTIKEEEYNKFHINSDGLVSIKMQNEWSIYADMLAVRRAKNTFGRDSVDLIYSPIALLFHELLKRQIPEKTTLCVYNHEKSVTLSIFKDKKMRLSTFSIINENQPSGDTNFTEQKLELEDITDIDNLIVKEESEASSIDDFQSLDDLLGDDKFQGFEDLGYDLNMPVSQDVEKSVALFGRDMNTFEYILSAIKEFYNNPLYDADFIEQIIVFDNTKTSATFLQYLESELLVETSVYPINTLEIMNELMYEEIKL
ncbi:hypothetical protein CCAL9344_07790 [Campylobacter sp. RM9344]|uniref:Uncharacterized protein n=1 Tax=Campylobacter californiensis TaxID=1032243 RepID=A0AAW3ZU24_9BACT|nr:MULTISPECIES: hypothetical protein [unclassified Campylobacter]MBE2983998.1 hypothetical protein [Campylobacter sp. RM6883]MBE2986160.1 hypothetical protein [Campylobacter sp. RM12919]MBE2987572.1 hypothetical protein [Campylobacter sp. RM12920]MBE2994536.1 hypothetical protein [Campylobacter sp. RM6913]MBE3022530.1 hypothetical protein [Campylobacter sp. 7477a]MBE3030079.1 hypothetical protein [Campylobacter sp. RM9344]